MPNCTDFKTYSKAPPFASKNTDQLKWSVYRPMVGIPTPVAALPLPLGLLPQAVRQVHQRDGVNFSVVLTKVTKETKITN